MTGKSPSVIITEAEFFGKQIQVTSYWLLAFEPDIEVRYDIVVDGDVKHPECTANDVMRALAFYMHGKGK